MRKIRGRLIAVEGIDQAGKKTQAGLLARNLRERGKRVSVWSFPDYTTTLGKQLKSYLERRIQLEMHTVHLLYAANKWEVAQELIENLVQGVDIIVNRYSPSNLAYGLAHGLPHDWLRSLEEGLPTPNMVVVLDIPPRMSLDRKRRGRDVHEGDLAYLSRVRKEYLRLAKRYGWRVVDGAQDLQTVQRLVWKKVASLV
jgi:dTMP kinase